MVTAYINSEADSYTWATGKMVEPMDTGQSKATKITTLLQDMAYGIMVNKINGLTNLQ